MIQFMGADMKMADDGSRIYIPRGPIFILAEKIVGFYDHTVLVGDHKIRVMEDLELIRKKVRDCEHVC